MLRANNPWAEKTPFHADARMESGFAAAVTRSRDSGSSSPTPPPGADPVGRAQDLAAKANELFIREQNYAGAIRLYSQAIQLVPTEEKFYGNRSMAHLVSGQPDSALKDADVCVRLQPAWPKGHFRRATALESLGRLAEAEAAYSTAIRHSPPNSVARSDYAAAQTACQGRQLTARGFSKEQSAAAISEYGSVHKAAENLCSTRWPVGAVAGEVLDSEDEESLGACATPPPRPLRNATNAVVAEPAPPLQPPRRREAAPRPQRVSTPPTAPTATTVALVAGDPLTDARNPLRCDTIWVGNLRSALTESELKSRFGSFGKVRGLALMIERHCAFISYADWRSAGKAMGEMQGALLHGAPVLVKFPDRALGGSEMKNVVLRKKRH